MEESNAFRLMVGITLPFAPWTSGKYDLAEQRSRLQIRSAFEEYDSMKIKIRNEVLNVLNDIAKTKETMNYYRDVMIPQTENMMRSMQYSYENKMADFLDILDAYRMLQESRSMLEEMTTMYLKMLVDLERVLGLNLKKSNISISNANNY
jgi:outer membrane protein TolC